MVTSRRQFLFQAASLASISSFARTAVAFPPAEPVVARPPCGPVRGQMEDGVGVFRGVPFAKAPVGPLRFRAPQAAQPWREVRDATKFASAAVQPDETGVKQSEDCLYLNVWTPQFARAAKDSRGLPVFVWIHGGGFTGGRSFDPIFDGGTFARNGVVCITVAYRLGVLGFLDAEPLLDGSYAGSGNNGLRDIVMALRWVQDNVSAFGGDPGRVTLGGESAGAKLTDLLMSVPSAQPLFGQMISESGGADRVWPLARAQEISHAFGREWTAKPGHSLADLRSAPAEQIIAAQSSFIETYPVHFPLRAEIDGTLLKEAPLESIRRGSTRGKRLLLGTNRDESALFLGPHPAEPTARDLGNLSVADFRPIADRYKDVYPGMSVDMQRIRSVTAEEYWVPSMRVADAHVSGGGEAFVYRLDFSEPTGRFAGMAFHSYDLRFVWDHFGQANVPPAAQAFARTVHAAWVSFIRGETPQADGLPKWLPYDTASQATMLLDSTSRLVSGPQAKELQLWQGKLMQ